MKMISATAATTAAMARASPRRDRMNHTATTANAERDHAASRMYQRKIADMAR